MRAMEQCTSYSEEMEDCNADEWLTRLPGSVEYFFPFYIFHQEAVWLHCWPLYPSHSAAMTSAVGERKLGLHRAWLSCTHTREGRYLWIAAGCFFLLLSLYFHFFYLFCIIILPLMPQATVSLLLTSSCMAHKGDRESQAMHPLLEWCLATPPVWKCTRYKPPQLDGTLEATPPREYSE